MDGFEIDPVVAECLQEWGITGLTDVQQRAVRAGVPAGKSAIVCAPTSSGKTLVGEMALVHALDTGMDALYLVSHKALAEQKFHDFHKRLSAARWKGSVTVGISTGDHEEGDINCRVLISTYEKALGLFLAGRVKLAKTLVIADEFQIVAEPGRGPSVETLCALLRQRKPAQFVGLTATVENPEDLAGWMNCVCVKSVNAAAPGSESTEPTQCHVWIASCPEYVGDSPSRFLPYAAGALKPESSVYVQAIPHLTAWDRTNDSVTRCVHAIGLFIIGEAERKVKFATGVSSGYLHRFAIELAWILDGLSCISGSSDLRQPQALTNNLSMLARRVRWGAPVEALDVLRIATRHGVPGFGRQRVMALLANGLSKVMDVLTAGRTRLVSLMGGDVRADALVAALSDNVHIASESFERLHVQLGKELGIEQKVVACNHAIGTDYENAVVALLREETTWSVEPLDDGKRQNVPDIQLVLGTVEMVIECKTTTKRPPLIAKEEAFAVLQKAADYQKSVRRITLGKPDFDETSKQKAAASTEVTLVRHAVFMEGLMRVLTGRLKAAEFVNWLAEPGVTDLSRLVGTPTFADRPQAGA